MYPVRPGIWLENRGNMESETHTHCRTWDMARKLTNEVNEDLTR
jgi:hypothetical protein